MNKCPYCGSVLPGSEEEILFCPECGQKIEYTPVIPQTEDYGATGYVPEISAFDDAVTAEVEKEWETAAATREERVPYEARWNNPDPETEAPDVVQGGVRAEEAGRRPTMAQRATAPDPAEQEESERRKRTGLLLGIIAAAVIVVVLLVTIILIATRNKNKNEVVEDSTQFSSDFDLPEQPEASPEMQVADGKLTEPLTQEQAKALVEECLSCKADMISQSGNEITFGCYREYDKATDRYSDYIGKVKVNLETGEITAINWPGGSPTISAPKQTPGPVVSPSATPTQTATPVATATPVPTAIPEPTAKPTATATPAPTPTPNNNIVSTKYVGNVDNAIYLFPDANRTAGTQMDTISFGEAVGYIETVGSSARVKYGNSYGYVNPAYLLDSAPDVSEKYPLYVTTDGVPYYEAPNPVAAKGTLNTGDSVGYIMNAYNGPGFVRVRIGGNDYFMERQYLSETAPAPSKEPEPEPSVEPSVEPEPSPTPSETPAETGSEEKRIEDVTCDTEDTITLQVSAGTPIYSIFVAPGNCESEETFSAHGVPTEIMISSGGESRYISLESISGDYSAAREGKNVRFDTPLISDGEITITITGVTESEAEDACFTEIALYS